MNKLFKNDNDLVDNCPIYDQLVNNILIERKSPLKASFNYICNLAHYKFKYSQEVINKDLDDTIKSLFDDVDLGYSFKTIKNINYHELEQIEQKIYNMESTLDDKLAIKKYYYKRQFNPLCYNEDELAVGWDNIYIYF